MLGGIDLVVTSVVKGVERGGIAVAVGSIGDGILRYDGWRRRRPELVAVHAEVRPAYGDTLLVEEARPVLIRVGIGMPGESKGAVVDIQVQNRTLDGDSPSRITHTHQIDGRFACLHSYSHFEALPVDRAWHVKSLPRHMVDGLMANGENNSERLRCAVEEEQCGTVAALLLSRVDTERTT